MTALRYTVSGIYILTAWWGTLTIPTEVFSPYIWERECAAALKKAIRGYTHRPSHEDVIVKDYGIDGFLIRFPLPDYIDSKAMAKAYFEDRCEYHYRPSPYDCTGQLFTRWYKLFLRNGRWWAYHSVGCDV